LLRLLLLVFLLLVLLLQSLLLRTPATLQLLHMAAAGLPG
jgi:hypothetical protein